MTEAVDAGAVDEAVRQLARGKAVVYPTETLYGLGVDALSPAALERLQRLKGARGGTGFSVLVRDWPMARSLAAGGLPEGAAALAEAFWPGPLTIVVAARRSVPERLRGAGGAVGLRCSPDPWARALLRAFGRPITSTSANPSGAAPAADIAQARAYFGDRVACYLDGGSREGHAASSVVEFSRSAAYLRRSGSIGREALAAVVPDLSMEC